ncbi:MAG: DUF2959 family protein [Verrucomicrobium sp.]|nr:DUF2959 family protein [Verrucomicrobium sp.]
MKLLIRLLCAVLLAACLSGGAHAEEDNAVRDAFRGLEKRYSLLQERLNNATAALERIASLMPGRDLKGPLADYSRNLEKFDSLNKTLPDSLSDFNERLAARYDAWRQQIGEIRSPVIRDLATKQLADRQAQFQLLNKDIAATEAKIGPLIGQMRDVESYLKAALTPASVEALAAPLQETAGMAKEAQRSMAALKGVFAQSRGALSTTPE